MIKNLLYRFPRKLVAIVVTRWEWGLGTGDWEELNFLPLPITNYPI